VLAAFNPTEKVDGRRLVKDLSWQDPTYPDAGSRFAGTGGRLPPAGQSPPRRFDAGHSDIGLQRRSFTSLSPNGPGSEKATDPDFDCAWGEKMRIGTGEGGSVPKVSAGHGLRGVSFGRRIGSISLRSIVRH
jgi:hypothetical protein